MLLTYLNTLKDKGNFTFEGISNLSGVPEATVKNIFSGKTSDPRFETVSAIVVAMGGSLDAVYCGNKEDAENESAHALKEIYEFQLSAFKENNEEHIHNIRAHYEQHHNDLRENYEKRLADKRELIDSYIDHIKTLKTEFLISKIALCVCVIVFIGVLIAELANPELGWFRY